MKRLPASLQREARLDLKAIHAWYEKQRKGLGAEFRSEFEERIALVRRFPEIGLLIQEDVRRVLLKRFPYIIVYRLLSGTIIIEGVFHARRDPKAWWERIE